MTTITQYSAATLWQGEWHYSCPTTKEAAKSTYDEMVAKGWPARLVPVRVREV